jgi:uncharacterized UPF0160 family protein
MMKVYTHSNTFHPDELLAIALLRETVLKGQDVPILRTRDEATLAAAQADLESFVIDVGFVYDPARLNFDHHQSSMVQTWPDGTPYSACGLIWIWLREQGALTEWGSPDVLNRLEHALVLPADRYDNGLPDEKPWAAGAFLSGYNRSGKPEVSDGAFMQALQAAQAHIRNLVYAVTKDQLNREIVEEALRTHRTPEGVLVIADRRGDNYTKWAACLDPTVNLVVTPRSEYEWVIITTPSDPSDPFSQKCPAPEGWRGQNEVKVDTAAGRAHVVFCHKSGFLTIVQGNQAQAEAVAQHIVKSHGAS